ncbi:MAG: IclR family transcriptional regulator [Planktomarina sp.]|nr:IclR family transcriptional regulator [Planktomarina sp.]
MSPEQRVPTSFRTLLILEVLGKSDRPMSATEINEKIELPKQTIHRLCAKLEQEGFLLRGGNGKKLRPTRRARLMASGILHSSSDHIARHQVMQRIAEDVGETVNFAVPTSDGMTYLERIETDWPFRVQLPVGTHVPFHCTASGKTFMASLLPKARHALVRSLRLQKLTDNTFIDAETLVSELKLVAKQGYAIDNEEFISGMVAIAVPITDDQGRYVASLAFHGPSQRLTVEKVISQKDVLLKGAQTMRDVLFC